ncbi:MAG: ABC transporter ATP-binding protein [Thermoproteota archaeon]
MKVVKASGLTKAFGNIIAVEEVSFDIDEGEVFGLLGPNGAGKTTVVRMLTGILKPDRGEAKIMGYDVHEEPLRAKMVMGVVPEEANPYPDLSVLENLRLVGRLYDLRRSSIEERVHRMIELFELKEAGERRAKNLSKGMRQKLLIAMALISEPRVLFLDEPTSGLDVPTARRVRGLIEDLKKGGTTILLTTHNVEEAGHLCDRVAIMKQRLIALGSPDELKIKAGRSSYLTITFDKPLGGDVECILEPYEHKIMGSKLLVVCNDPNDLIMKVVEYAKARDLRILNMSTSQPSLEDVFVRLVGGGAG